MAQGETFASPSSDLLTPNVGTLTVAPQPTGGQGLALDPTGHLAASLIKGYPNDKTKALLGDGSWGGVAATVSTTLSGSPTDGMQTILVDSTSSPTYAWHLQYSSAASKWLFVGGSPAYAEVQTSESTATGSYTALTTAGPSFTVPRAGDYMVEIGCFFTPAGVNLTGNMSYDIGGTGAVDADSIEWQMGNGGLQISISSMRARKKQGLAASTALVAKYKGGGAGMAFANRFMAVTPVFVT